MGAIRRTKYIIEVGQKLLPGWEVWFETDSKDKLGEEVYRIGELMKTGEFRYSKWRASRVTTTPLMEGGK